MDARYILHVKLHFFKLAFDAIELHLELLQHTIWLTLIQFHHLANKFVAFVCKYKVNLIVTTLSRLILTGLLVQNVVNLQMNQLLDV